MEKSLQDRLFEHVRMQLHPLQNLAVEISELLQIKLDAAYRRINGTTELKLSEAQVICDHYGISLDDMIRKKSNSIPFYGFFENIGLQESIKTGFKHLLDVLEDLEGNPGAEITYLCMEIPFLYLLQVPDLFNFKSYVWEYVDNKDSILPPFSKLGTSSFPNEFSGLANRLVNSYINVPSIEIIHHSALTATARQILYFLESGKLSCPSDALILFENLHNLVAHLKNQVTMGKKSRFGSQTEEHLQEKPLQFYFNEMLPVQNTVAIKRNDAQMVYLECNITDFIWTSEPQFCRQVFRTIEGIMANSVPISKVSAKERHKYFLQLEAEILAVQRIAEEFLNRGQL